MLVSEPLKRNCNPSFLSNNWTQHGHFEADGSVCSVSVWCYPRGNAGGGVCGGGRGKGFAGNREWHSEIGTLRRKATELSRMSSTSLSRAIHCPMSSDSTGLRGLCDWPFLPSFSVCACAQQICGGQGQPPVHSPVTFPFYLSEAGPLLVLECHQVAQASWPMSSKYLHVSIFHVLTSLGLVTCISGITDMCHHTTHRVWGGKPIQLLGGKASSLRSGHLPSLCPLLSHGPF